MKTKLACIVDFTTKASFDLLVLFVFHLQYTVLTLASRSQLPTESLIVRYSPLPRIKPNTYTLRIINNIHTSTH